jgi:hypothetical protein
MGAGRLSHHGLFRPIHPQEMAAASASASALVLAAVSAVVFSVVSVVVYLSVCQAGILVDSLVDMEGEWVPELGNKYPGYLGLQKTKMMMTKTMKSL